MPTAHIRGSQVFLTECVWRKSCCQSVNMSKVQTLRAFVNQRLSAAAEEIFDVFERTIAEYEEELCRQHKLLDAVLKPEVRLHRADVQLVMVTKEEDPPEQQEWRPSLDQEDPPELPHIKEEEEELWTSQEGEQLRGLEEDEIIKFTFSPVTVKSEEEDEEDCGGSDPDRKFNPYNHLKPAADDKRSHSFEPETDESCDWEETGEPQSSLNSLQNNEGAVSDEECNPGETSLSSSECASSFGNKEHLQEHGGIQADVKPFICSICGKRYNLKKSFRSHMRLHSEGKRFSCSVCNKTFQKRGDVVTHLRIHTGEKPFSCSVCGRRFTQKEHLRRHLTTHTGEKPFSCSVCGARFAQSSTLTSHLRVHAGEKPFSCSVCKASFSFRSNLSQHMRTHTGEKPFCCSICGRGFAQSSNLTSHIRVHTGERPFSCSICEASFSLRGNLFQHMRMHTGEKPFSCSVCDKTFAHKGALTQHLTVHTSETD